LIIQALIVAGAGTFWHLASSAKIGKSPDAGAVVNSNLKVFGLKHVHVAELSIMPFSLKFVASAKA